MNHQLVNDHLALAAATTRRFIARYGLPPYRALDADDLESEAYLALCHAAEHWNPERGKFSTLAVTVIENHLKNFAWNRKALDLVSLDAPLDEERALGEVLPDPAPGPDEQCEQAATRDAVRAALQRLPDRDREVMEALLDGHTTAELAQRDGVSRQRIDQIRARSFERMRRSLIAFRCPVSLA